MQACTRGAGGLSGGEQACVSIPLSVDLQSFTPGESRRQGPLHVEAAIGHAGRSEPSFIHAFVFSNWLSLILQRTSLSSLPYSSPSYGSSSFLFHSPLCSFSWMNSGRSKQPSLPQPQAGCRPGKNEKLDIISAFQASVRSNTKRKMLFLALQLR